MRGRALGAPTPPHRKGLRPRPRVSTELIHSVADVVTNRDKAICIDSFEHRFLTTRQVFQLHFSDLGRTRHRLHRLYELRVLERFRPRRDTGSHPYHYVLDDIGLWIAAAYLGCDPKELAYDKRKALALVYSPHLLHMREANDFFCALSHRLRGRGSDHRLAEWLGERSCQGRWGGLVTPDGYAEIEGPWGALDFFLELDGGTEQGARLAEKLLRYSSLAGMQDCPDAILFCFPSSEREAAARKALYDCGIEVATAVLKEHLRDPLGANWLSLSRRRRMRLREPSRTGEERVSA